MRMRFVLFIGCLLVLSSFSSHAESQPSPGSSWIGHHTVKVCASAGFPPLYASPLFRPTFDVDISSAPNSELNLHLQTLGHGCNLRATQSGSSLVLVKNQTCQLGIATHVFCVLAENECKTSGERQNCEEEDRLHHLGTFIGTITRGELSRHDGQVQLTFEANVAGCVLVPGQAKNVPITVKGAQVSSVICSQ